MTTQDHPGADGPLRVGFVPGVTPDTWARRWAERMPRRDLDLVPVAEADQTTALAEGRVDMCLVRLPVEDEAFHVIPLYREVPVVVVPRGHFVEAADEVTLADLADEHVHRVPPLTVAEAVATIAAGVGVIVVPLSVARMHHRKDVTHRPVTDAPETRVGLAWRRDLDDHRVETFVGVVRGRTVNSSRGQVAEPPGPAPRRSRRQPPRHRPQRRTRRSGR